MFDAIPIIGELLAEKSLHLLRLFLDPRNNCRLELNHALGSESPISVSFIYQGASRTALVGEVLVKNRKTQEIDIVTAENFDELFYDYPEELLASNKKELADVELKKLADYLLKHYPEKIGEKQVDGSFLETAVDVALNLLQRTGVFLQEGAPGDYLVRINRLENKTIAELVTEVSLTITAPRRGDIKKGHE
jgi:hypothetical protein